MKKTKVCFLCGHGLYPKDKERKYGGYFICGVCRGSYTLPQLMAAIKNSIKERRKKWD